MEQRHPGTPAHVEAEEPGAAKRRVGLAQLAQPRFGELKEAAVFVRAALDTFSNDNDEGNELCCIEISVDHGVLVASRPQAHINGPSSSSTKFLTDPKCEALRKQAPDFVVDMLTRTGQAAYILANADALCNDEFILLVEMGCYNRSGSGEEIGFHKDTRGYTLFLLLAYWVAQGKPGSFRGPEHILNPPRIARHLEYIEKLLPEVFIRDLKRQFDELPLATRIEFPAIPNAGFFAGVDELMHHTTPLGESRNIQFRWEDVDGKGIFRDAIERHCAGGAQARDQYKILSDARCFGWLPFEYADQAHFDEATKLFPAVVRQLASLPQFFTPADLSHAVGSPEMFDEIFYRAPRLNDRLKEVQIVHNPMNDPRGGRDFATPLPGLKRQVSQNLLDKTPMPPLPAVRPFVRMGVLAMRRATYQIITRLNSL